MGLFSIIVPRATENLFLDPQFGQADPDTHWDFAGDGAQDFTRSEDEQWAGVGSALADFGGGTYATIYRSVTVDLTTYSLQAMVRRAAGGVVTASHVQARFNSGDVAWGAIVPLGDGWYRCTLTAGASPVSKEFGVKVLEDGMYVDACQLEEQDEATTYGDGEQEGCLWSGYTHGSTSVRSAQSRAGGVVRDLRDDFGFYINSVIGMGMTTLRGLTQKTPLLPGESYQGTKEEKRQGTLIGSIHGTSLANLHTVRSSLIAAMAHNVTSPEQALRLRYNNGARVLQIPTRYDGGLQGSARAGFSETLALRLTAYDQPHWGALGQVGHAVDGQSTVANANFIAQRSAAGVWSALGSGMDSYILSMATGPDGNLYLAGAFTTAGGTPANRIAMWDGEAWSALGSGLNDICRAIVFGPDGTLYAAGNFTTAGGGAAVRVAKWDGAAWSALGSGMNATVWDLAFGPDGKLYAVGAYTTAGGGAALRVAAWDGATWSALGAGLDGTAYSVAFPHGGKLYAAGTFLNAGGGGAVRIAEWDGVAWSALGAGANDTIWDVIVGNGGIVYIAGEFTTAGGVACQHVARWNGTIWSAMGNGIPDDIVDKLALGPDGIIYAIGDFAEVNGVESKYIAKWNVDRWIPMDFVMPPGGSNTGQAIDVTPTNVLTFAYWGTGTATVPNTFSLVNGGTADAYPVIEVVGPGRLLEIRNWTLGLSLYFDIDLLDGETITLDLEKKSLASDFRGNIIDVIQPGSKLSTWRLQPGSNDISSYTDTDAMEISFLWRKGYLSADG